MNNSNIPLYKKYIMCSVKNLLNYAFFDHQNLYELAEEGSVLSMADLIKNSYNLGPKSLNYLENISQNRMEQLSADECYVLFLKYTLVDNPELYIQIQELEKSIKSTSQTVLDRINAGEKLHELVSKLNSFEEVKYLASALKKYKTDAKNGDIHASSMLIEIGHEHPFLCDFDERTFNGLKQTIYDAYKKDSQDIFSKYLFGKTALMEGNSIQVNLEGKRVLQEMTTEIDDNLLQI